MRSEATVVILAAHLYRVDNDSFPDSLDRLVCDGYLEQVPIDPFSGKPLIYNKQGDSFILYSVGADTADNNGKQPEREESSSEWREKTGCDIVFWPVEN